MTDSIFVFGSNQAGIHGAGAARLAYDHFGAVLHVGHGRQGNSYAIPTKDYNIRTLPIPVIKQYVDIFVNYTQANPQENFFITRVGCGLAGYSNEEIAPFFKMCGSNCSLPEPWKPFLEKIRP